MNLWVYIIIFTVIYGVAIAFDKAALLPDYISQIKDIVSWLMTLGVAGAVSTVNKKVEATNTIDDVKKINNKVNSFIRL